MLIHASISTHSDHLAERYTHPVFPTVLISLEVGGAHAFIIVVGIQTLLGVVALLRKGVFQSTGLETCNTHVPAAGTQPTQRGT